MNTGAQFSSVSFTDREAQAEKITCLVWLVVIAFTYTFFNLSFRDTVDESLASNITLLVLIMMPAFAIIAMLISAGYYSSTIKYINTFLQVSLVSAAILFDGMAQGTAYALSSMPPMAYALVPMITAFRLQPMLGLFAGAVSSIQFLLIYLLVLKPSPELIIEIPSLSFEVTMMKVVVLFSLGVASSLAARSLKNYFENFTESTEMRNRLQRNFGRFVSPEIVTQIENSEDGMLTSNEQEAAIVFGDIRGFTNYSSKVSSREVTDLLNAYFEIVCNIVEEEKGMVNKFLGDGYLAFFGLYSNDDTPCESAARAVLRIKKATNALLEPHGLSTGAAANFGKIITGEMGSRGRCEFTGIGAEVNLTSRLEGLNKRLKSDFLVTQDFVGKLPANHFNVKYRGEQAVRGLDKDVPLFEVLP